MVFTTFPDLPAFPEVLAEVADVFLTGENFSMILATLYSAADITFSSFFKLLVTGLIFSANFSFLPFVMQKLLKFSDFRTNPHCQYGRKNFKLKNSWPKTT